MIGPLSTLPLLELGGCVISQERLPGGEQWLVRLRFVSATPMQIKHLDKYILTLLKNPLDSSITVR